jgi:ribonuclease P protein component
MKARKYYVRLGKSGGKFFYSSFIAQVLPSFSETGMVGITATKRLGNSVFRHRAKRRLREVLRLWDKSSKNILPYDVVLIARSAIFEIDFKDLRDEWSSMIEKVSKSRVTA